MPSPADKIFVMSARPGRILREHHVPFARPRDLEIMYHTDFNDMVHELHGEIAKARVVA
jgi:NitT/TauT family transport system ATP-binding protein